MCHPPHALGLATTLLEPWGLRQELSPLPGGLPSTRVLSPYLPVAGPCLSFRSFFKGHFFRKPLTPPG